MKDKTKGNIGVIGVIIATVLWFFFVEGEPVIKEGQFWRECPLEECKRIRIDKITQTQIHYTVLYENGKVKRTKNLEDFDLKGWILISRRKNEGS